MKRLILMRHAKSDWGREGLRDHDRPLSLRGRLAAPLMAAWLREIGASPDVALVSSAARTRETWDRMAFDAADETHESLYHASAEAMLKVARGAPDAAGTALLLAHQPGIEDFADRLLDGERVDGFPTAKIAIVEFARASWRDLAFGAGALVAEAAPKTLV